MATRKTRQKIALALGLAAALPACKTPSINLSTNDPIKVDIAMRLDVYNHDAAGSSPKPAASPTPSLGKSAAERARNREADIQVFKNSRLVGEGRDGLLAILTEPAGDFGDTVRRTVAAENADRMTRMKTLAAQQKRSLVEVQREQATLWTNRSFKGEWIETQKTDGTSAWTQKPG